MTKIYAPNKGYTGKVAGVSFNFGVAITDNRRMIDWFIEKGYKVVHEEKTEQVIEENFEDKTVSELKDMARGKGLTGFSRLNKGELIELLVGE